MQILFITIYTFIDLLLIKLLKKIELFKNVVAARSNFFNMTHRNKNINLLLDNCI